MMKGFLCPPPCRSCGLSDSGPSMSKIEDEDAVEIRDVWADNLEAEFAVIRDVVDDFAFVAMDTEFPGVAVRPLGEFKTVADHNYRILRANVDLLHLIKLGLTFSDAGGNLPTSSTAGARPIVRQFNFREFDVGRDVSNPTPSTSSGNRALICRGIGRTGSTPSVVYDIKHLLKFSNSLHGGLNNVAEQLEVERVGICHQAGSDSLLTARAFRKLMGTALLGQLRDMLG
ncbi:CAF1 family ribonuclease [Musa troglodytarum]|uniref:poly(A)-specific ribonuclease n=1 Tax=Musa troglodytarum TaxID=320322 RepID=A0A9E7EGT6_9LILI|nr:CAF1 family ribonuclease [Musa troglodytarum]